MKNLVHEEFKCYRDGLRINGTMFRPKGEGKFPTIIISHEFMMNRITTVYYAYVMAKMGYAAFCYDFNGGGTISQSQGKTTKMSVLTEIEDLKAVLKYVSELPYTDMDNLSLWGCSMGGMVSAMVAAELGEEKVKNLILFYPALSIPDDARKGQMILAKFDPKNVPNRLFCGPIVLGKCFAEDVMDLDPYPIISKYHGPVYLFHGTPDHIVAYDYSVRANEVYTVSNVEAQKAGEIDALPPVMFYSFKDGHMFLNPIVKHKALNVIRNRMKL